MKSKAVTQMNSETTLPNSQAESQVTKSAIDLQVEIRYRAYLLYEQRGKEDGHDIDDWLQAESELIDVENKSNRLEQALMMGASLRQRALSHR